MNRSFSKIRHIQEANSRLEKKMLSEQTLPINDESNWWTEYGFDSEESFKENYEEVDEYAHDLIQGVEDKLQELLIKFFERIDLGNIVRDHQEMFKERYPEYSDENKFYNENIDNLMTANTNPDSEELMDKIIDGGVDSLFNYIFYTKK